MGTVPRTGCGGMAKAVGAPTRAGPKLGIGVGPRGCPSFALLASATVDPAECVSPTCVIRVMAAERVGARGAWTVEGGAEGVGEAIGFCRVLRRLRAAASSLPKATGAWVASLIWRLCSCEARCSGSVTQTI